MFHFNTYISSFLIRTISSNISTLCACFIFSGGAKKGGKTSHFIPKMNPKESDEHHRRYVIFCAIESKPFNLAAGQAFRYFIGGLSPSYVSQTIHPETIHKHLIELSTEVKTAITAKLKAHHDLVIKLGWYGPFVGIQMDLTTTFNTEYITVALSFVSDDWSMERKTVYTKAFPGRHTQEEIERWIRKVSLVLCVAGWAPFLVVKLVRRSSIFLIEDAHCCNNI